MKSFKSKLTEVGHKVDEVVFDQFKDKVLNIILEREKEYMEMITSFGKAFEEKEVEFLQKFQIKYETVVVQIDDMKEKISRSLLEVAEKAFHNVHDVFDDLDHILNPQYIFSKIDEALNFDLEIFPLLIFLGCSVFCLGASCVYHTFYVMSPTISKILQRLDMSGITVLIFGATYATLFYYFYCQPMIRLFYFLASLIACTVVFVISMCDFIHKAEWNKTKGFMYGGLGISSGIPMLHAFIQSLFSDSTNDFLPVNGVYLGLIAMGATYLIGMYIYVDRFPEKYYPRVFDIWLNSHVIWHVFVFVATLIEMYTLFYLYSTRKDVPCKLRI